MVWASFSGYVPVTLEFISCKMSSEEYQKVLDDHWRPYFTRFRRRNLSLSSDITWRIRELKVRSPMRPHACPETKMFSFDGWVVWINADCIIHVHPCENLQENMRMTYTVIGVIEAAEVEKDSDDYLYPQQVL
ncbi:hypothetical protein NECAME_11219 [Necator americanus]|uniref:Uncharacterized protein n=1 Tax=Necator americanus TaxID=51031 RepID=W2T7S8_NECAM|nr:hypothetical protein NECAME_11219 [Necator americanus]ETN77221.1 hypothetical protein NECAME_11219 [Necator americanus]